MTEQNLEQVFDLDSTLDRVCGDVDFLCELIEMFAEQTPGVLTKLSVAQVEGNREDVAELAHRLKSSAGNFSAQRAYSQAAMVEDIARSGGDWDSRRHVGDLVDSVEELLDELLEYRSAAQKTS